MKYTVNKEDLEECINSLPQGKEAKKTMYPIVKYILETILDCLEEIKEEPQELKEHMKIHNCFYNHEHFITKDNLSIAVSALEKVKKQAQDQLEYMNTFSQHSISSEKSLQFIVEVASTVLQQIEGEEKCGCGKQNMLGGADMELTGICHRVGNPCYYYTQAPKPEECKHESSWSGSGYKCRKCGASIPKTFTKERGTVKVYSKEQVLGIIEKELC